MHPGIESACRVIESPAGETFLRTLRSLYGDGPAADAGLDRDSLLAAGQAGLLEPSTGSSAPGLSATGYLVGNVAKEYCNWVDHGRRMPAPRPAPSLIDGREVLDLGCGLGRWLWEFQRTARSVVGVELQAEYIALGAALARREGLPTPRILAASADRFELPDASVDTVFCRLVLNHVPLDPTLARIARVLRPGGTLWVQVETPRFALSSLIRARRLRSRLFYAFGLFNTAYLLVAGAQLHLAARGRMHERHRSVYPPLRWWPSYLSRRGFRGFSLLQRRDGTFTFLARRSPASGSMAQAASRDGRAPTAVAGT